MLRSCALKDWPGLRAISALWRLAGQAIQQAVNLGTLLS
jgi:hypothetical protein